MPNESLIMAVRAALARIGNPASGRNIVADGMIAGLSATEAGIVRFTLDAGSLSSAAAAALLEEARAAAAQVAGVARVAAFGTAHIAKGAHEAPPPRGGHDNPIGLDKRQRIDKAEDSLPGVINVVAVASGKGGVGKSTIAANLAVAFAQRGFVTGLLDADIYGPSLPTLFGLRQRPQIRDGKIVPVEAFGVSAMSIGLLVEPEKALAWRGPMVMGALRQLMSDVAWGPLDLLVIDTPPGTGDIHISLAQSKRLTGAVIVSTPQELALADVRRGVELFRSLRVPILGVVENMAWIETESGARQYVFGEGGAERAAAKIDAPFLGAVPLYQDLREASDAGAPIVASAPGSPAAKAISRIADALTPGLTL